MTNMKVFFEFDGNTVTATGTIWDNGSFVDNLNIIVEDENYDTVRLASEDFELVKELAEEIMLDKHTISEVEF